MESARLTLTIDDVATTPSGPAPVVEVRVDDVQQAVDAVRAAGGRVLVEPVLTDWGTISAFVEGPDGLVVEYYRDRGR